MRRIGVLTAMAPEDPDTKARLAAFGEALERLGWSFVTDVILLTARQHWHGNMGCEQRVGGRWLIGEPSTGPLYRLWLDTGFALIVFLFLTSLIRESAPFIPRDLGRIGTNVDLVLYFLAFATPAAYSLQLKATLGLRDTRPIWGPLINGSLVGLVASLPVYGIATKGSLFVLLAPFVGGLAYGAVAVFQFRRSGYRGGIVRHRNHTSKKLDQGFALDPTGKYVKIQGVSESVLPSRKPVSKLRLPVATLPRQAEVTY